MVLSPFQEQIWLDPLPAKEFKAMRTVCSAVRSTSNEPKGVNKLPQPDKSFRNDWPGKAKEARLAKYPSSVNS